MICASPTTLHDFLLRRYVPSRVDLCVGAIRQMEITIRKFEEWYGGTIHLADLTEDCVREFLAEYRRNHASATTNSKRCQLLAIWQCAFEEELVERPPRRTKVRKARSQPRIPEAWTPDEFAKLVKAAKADCGAIGEINTGDWWESLLLVCYDTGERRGAVLATTPGAIDLEGGWVTFFSRKGGVPRICPLHMETIAALHKIWNPRRNLVWPWPYSREAFDKRFRKICGVAGITCGRECGGLMHKIRRTTGTLIEANGGDGAKAIGNTRRVFELHYRDPRFFDRSNFDRLPRPIAS